MNDYYLQYISHHGVLGQKWGVKNGPPYPLICVNYDTHNAIHYGDLKVLAPTKPIERKPNDQTPWK